MIHRSLPPRRALAALAALATLALAACDEGDGPAGPGTTPVATVSVAPDTATLAVGTVRTLGAVARAADGSALAGRVVAWTSSNEAVARVSDTGVVVGIAAGQAVIAATSEGRRGQALVTVRLPAVPNPIPVAAALAPAQVTAGGPELTLTVTGTDFREGAWIVVDGLPRQTAYVGATELRTTLSAQDRAAPRTLQVQAVNPVPGGGVSAPLVLTVTPQGDPVAAVTVRPAVVVTRVSPTAVVSLEAVLRNGAGAPLEGRHVTWTSSAPHVATVSDHGLVRPISAGEATITATSEGRVATSVVTVSPWEMYHLVYDRGGTGTGAEGLFTHDMRTGMAQRMWPPSGGQLLRDPAVSPDDRHVAYAIHQPGGSQIAILDRVRRTFVYLGAGGDHPAWSPDGARIAFRGVVDGRRDVWVKHADGSTAGVNLTADLPAGSLSERPVWSPTGDRIVFGVRDQTGRTSLWMMNADGTGKRQLTWAELSDTDATWHGSSLVFTRQVAPGSMDLYRLDLNLAGATPVRLTQTGNAMMPAWSPDGRWIAFVARDLSNGEASVMALDPWNGEIRPISLPGDGPLGGGTNPAWFRQR